MNNRTGNHKGSKSAEDAEDAHFLRLTQISSDVRSPSLLLAQLANQWNDTSPSVKVHSQPVLPLPDTIKYPMRKLPVAVTEFRVFVDPASNRLDETSPLVPSPRNPTTTKRVECQLEK